MPGIVRRDDVHTGHSSPTPNPFHKTKYVGGSPDVYVNKRNAIRAENTDKTSCTDPASAGSPNVYVNGKKVHRLKDATGGHGSWVPNAAASASEDVFANDRPGAEKFTFDFSTTDPIILFPTPNPYQSNSYTGSYPDPAPGPGPNSDTMTSNPEIVDVPEAPQTTEVCVIADGERNPYEVAVEMMNSGDWNENEGSGQPNPYIIGIWEEMGFSESAAFSVRSGEDDHTAWCAIFAGACLKRAGLAYKQTFRSRDFLTYGTEVASGSPPSLENAQAGDVLVFYRAEGGGLSGSGGRGHVGIYTGTNTGSRVGCIGGNQGNTLQVRNYGIANTDTWGLIGIRRGVSCVDETTPPPEADAGSLGEADDNNEVT